MMVTVSQTNKKIQVTDGLQHSWLVSAVNYVKDSSANWLNNIQDNTDIHTKLVNKWN